jgi:hypothetical protein
MEHLSDWHNFKPNDRKTYPRIKTTPVLVRLSDGSTFEAKSFQTFMKGEPDISVVAWRYIKGPEQ